MSITERNFGKITMLKLVLVGLMNIWFLSGIAAVTINQTVAELQPKFPTPCTTPNYEQGLCVTIQNCKVLIDALESGRNDSHNFIRNSRCGPHNEHQDNPKVCCGHHANYLHTTIIPTTTTRATTQTSSTTKRSKRPHTNPFPKHCGNHTLAIVSRIFGGTEASLGEFPWMVRLRHRTKDGQLNFGCAGFLIAKDFVLTAAHCIRSKVLEPLGPLYDVLVGEHDTERDPDCVQNFKGRVCADSPQYLRTAKPVVHPEYSDNINHYNDIALIPLKEAANFSAYVYPICLSKNLSNKTEMWLSGWGKTETREESPIKLKVSIPRADKSHCAYLYDAVEVKVVDSQLCAGGEAGRDSCSGDSGGPIMVQTGTGSWYAEGVVSFGLGCGVEGWPGIYTSLPNYIPWIKKAANRYLRKHEGGGSNNKQAKMED